MFFISSLVPGIKSMLLLLETITGKPGTIPVTAQNKKYKSLLSLNSSVSIFSEILIISYFF